MEPFTILEHPSDIGLQASGRTLDELFQNAARGMFSIMLGTYEASPQHHVALTIESTDRESLLVKWLNELLFFFENHGFVFAKADFAELTDTKVRATVYGDSLHRCIHEVHVCIKAVTYHHLSIEQRNEQWVARVYFDV